MIGMILSMPFTPLLGFLAFLPSSIRAFFTERTLDKRITKSYICYCR